MDLARNHQQQLDASAISEDVAKERGYQSLSGRHGFQVLREHGFSRPQSENLPGLLLPVWGTDGHQADLAVYRPDVPRLLGGDNPRKYEFPRGKTMRLDCPPRCHHRLGVPDVPLWITEGQKKGDALAAHGACAIALLGVDCWRGKNSVGGSTALGDWDYVHLRDRDVYIVFDSDMQTKPAVKGAMRRLANFLRAKQANVGVVFLPSTDDGQKQGVDDCLAAGMTIEALLTRVEDPWHDQPTDDESAALARKNGLPKIRLVPGELSSIVVAAEQAILTWQETRQPVVFQRAGRLCFIVRDLASPQWLNRPPDLPQVQIATPHKLRAFCNETAAWYKFDGRRSAWKLDLPPLPFVTTLLERGEWHLPPLRGIATRPFFRANRTLCTQPGYDAETGVYLECPLEATQLTIPPAPDIFMAQHAVALLKELFADFPLQDTDRDFAAILAALLTLIARPAIDGQTPLFAITSSTPGSGKGLLADLLCLIATGDVAPRWAPTREAEEERKRLMTIAVAGEQVVLIDNVQGALGSEALDMAITSGVVHDRALGSHGLLKAPFTTTMFATGNNMNYRGDMARRVVPIALRPNMEHPEDRNDFRIPHIRQYCRREQRTFLEAACTILLAYIADDCPSPPTGSGSFEEWNSLIRGAVLWVTGTDPLEGQRAIVPRDPDLEQWGMVLEAWERCVGDAAWTVSMVLHRLHEYTQAGMMDDDWRDLRDALAGLDARGDGTKLNARVIGNAFSKYHGRIIDQRRASDAGTFRRAKQWRVEKIE